MIRSKGKLLSASVCLLLVLGTFALYWPVRHFDFVQYDDPEYVFENPTVRSGLSWWGLAWSVVDAHAANWHPLTWLSHMLDCQLFGLRPGAHHLVNVLLHSANAALLFLLLRSMTGAFWRCVLVAAWFAWHPLRVESVAWIAERKDVLSGFFFMLTVWAYVLYAKERALACAAPSLVRSGDSPASSRGFGATGFYRLALLMFALGLLSKPMLVTLPAVLLLLDVWPLNRIEPLRALGIGAGKEEIPKAWFKLRMLLLEKWPFFLLAGVSAVLTWLAQKAGGAVVLLRSEGIPQRTANALLGCVTYLEKFFWPADMTCLYLRPQTVSGASLVLGGVVLLAISIAVGLAFRQRPFLAVGWLWYLGMLLPVSGLVQVGLQSVADRYTYLPGIGVGLMVAWGSGDLVSGLRSRRTGTLALAVGGGLLLCSCIALTRQQLAYWRNTETLMKHALEVDPGNYVAHQNLAVYYSRIGRDKPAQHHRQRVRELDPAITHNSANSCVTQE